MDTSRDNAEKVDKSRATTHLESLGYFVLSSTVENRSRAMKTDVRHLDCEKSRMHETGKGAVDCWRKSILEKWIYAGP
jgi:hypothetical protein